jgi:hypothetical protein
VPICAAKPDRGWFDGKQVGFIALDDVFLTMEGIGLLLIYT